MTHEKPSRLSSLYGRLSLIMAAGIGLVFIYAPDLGPKKTDWAEVAREQTLQPCYGNAIFVNLGAQEFKRQWALPDEERETYAAAGRIIPEGHHEGVVIPETCFAVAQGLYGFTVTFWTRPRDENGDYDMTIPYWNPGKHSLSREAIMADAG